MIEPSMCRDARQRVAESMYTVHRTDWNAVLADTSHRPYPLPRGRLKGTMSWHDLLFAHYRVDPTALRAAVPRSLELDLWQGEAWLGVVPFYMSNVGLPSAHRMPWLSAFEELNVRTYVRHRGKSGVYFFSLDAANWAAVLGARAGFRLPYFWARMRRIRQGSEVLFHSRRLLGPPARFEARYGPAGAVFRSQVGTLEHWLTERYCLFTVGRQGEPYRADIHHQPWALQAGHGVITTLDIPSSRALALEGQRPLLHFARRNDVMAWPLRHAKD
jgi:uncharacterized protein YqjF (DUF2071 family)